MIYDSDHSGGNVASESQTLPPTTEPLSAQVARQITDNQTHLTAMWNEFTTRFGLTQASADILKPMIPKIKALEETNTNQHAQIFRLNEDLDMARRIIRKNEMLAESLVRQLDDLKNSLERKTLEFNAKSSAYDALLVSRNETVEQCKRLELDVKGQKSKSESMEKELKVTKEDSKQTKELMYKERAIALKVMMEERKRYSTLQAKLDETESRHQDVLELLGDQIETLEKSLSSAEDERDTFVGLSQTQQVDNTSLKFQLLTAEMAVGEARRTRDEAKKAAETYEAELREIKHYCGRMEDEMAEDRKTWDEESAKLRERSTILDERVKQLELEFSHQHRQKEAIEEEKARLQIQLSERAEDAFLASQSAQLQLSAAKHALRHYKNLEAQTSLTLTETQERERETQSALQKAEQRYEDRVLELAVWKSGAEENESRVRELLQRLSVLEEDSARTKAEEERLRTEIERLASLPPPPPAAPAEIEQHMRFLETRTKDAERRLRDAVEEKLYLREKALECEELERELEETVERLGAVETRLREVVDENADLRRRQYKW